MSAPGSQRERCVACCSVVSHGLQMSQHFSTFRRVPKHVWCRLRRRTAQYKLRFLVISRFRLVDNSVDNSVDDYAHDTCLTG